MESDLLTNTVLPMIAGVLVMLGVSYGVYHLAQKSTRKAMSGFDSAMHGVAQRLGIRYRAPTERYDWPGATGRYRDRTIAFFIVTETEASAKTGILVNYSRMISPDVLGALKVRRGPFLGRKLYVRTSAGPAAASALPAAAGDALERLLAASSQVEVHPDRLAVQLCRDQPDFGEFDMVMDVDHLCEVVDSMLDVALALERL